MRRSEIDAGTSFQRMIDRGELANRVVVGCRAKIRVAQKSSGSNAVRTIGSQSLGLVPNRAARSTDIDSANRALKF